MSHLISRIRTGGATDSLTRTQRIVLKRVGWQTGIKKWVRSTLFVQHALTVDPWKKRFLRDVYAQSFLEAQPYDCWIPAIKDQREVVINESKSLVWQRQYLSSYKKKKLIHASCACRTVRAILKTPRVFIPEVHLKNWWNWLCEICNKRMNELVKTL